MSKRNEAMEGGRAREAVRDFEWDDVGLVRLLEREGVVRPHVLSDAPRKTKDAKQARKVRESRSGMARRARRGLVDEVVSSDRVREEALLAYAIGRPVASKCCNSMDPLAKTSPKLYAAIRKVRPDQIRALKKDLDMRTVALSSGANGCATALRLVGESKRPTRDAWVVLKSEKPLRGKCGFAPIKDPQRTKQVDRELVVAPALSKTSIESGLRTIVETPRVVWASFSHPHKGGWPVMELLTPLRIPQLRFKVPDIKTMFAFPERFGFHRVLHVVFQVIWTIATLQRALPGFRHNDFHGGNIMLTNWDRKSHAFVLRPESSETPVTFMLRNADTCIKIIDFGYTSWSEPGRVSELPSVTRDTGISSEENAFYDTAQFLFLLHLGMQQRNAPKWANLFLRFIWDVLPRRFLTTRSRDQYDYLTSKTANSLKKSTAWTPDQMLLHPIFAPLRTRSVSDATSVTTLSTSSLVQPPTN